MGREVEARNKRAPGSSKGMNSGKDSAGQPYLNLLVNHRFSYSSCYLVMYTVFKHTHLGTGFMGLLTFGFMVRQAAILP